MWGNSSPQAYDHTAPSTPPTYTSIFFTFSLLEGETPPGANLDGNPRIEDGSGIGSKIVDLGAYEFPPAAYALTCDGTGSGVGTTVGTAPSSMNCTSTAGTDTGTCSEMIDINTDVVLTATPASGSTFLGWVGCDNAVGNVCTQSISNGDETVQPIFMPEVIFIGDFE